MPRNMSFMLTTDQIRNRTKTVTRRFGWNHIKVGEILNACEKCQGLKKGEKIVKLATIRVVGKKWIDVESIDRADLVKEGFPNMTPDEFIGILCGNDKRKRAGMVNRIEFEYLD